MKVVKNNNNQETIIGHLPDLNFKVKNVFVYPVFRYDMESGSNMR